MVKQELKKGNKRKMKNRKNKIGQIGQYIAASAGAALLAFVSLATPKTATAATLSKNESGEWVSTNAEEAVDKILNLEVNGIFYDVQFSRFNFDFPAVDSDGYRTFWGENSAAGAKAISEALGTSLFTNKRDGAVHDDFMVLSGIYDSYLVIDFEQDSSLSEDGVLTEGVHGEYLVDYRAELEVYPVAMYKKSSSSSASTPEPSLIFGFITLGALMVGGKRKTNG